MQQARGVRSAGTAQVLSSAAQRVGQPLGRLTPPQQQPEQHCLAPHPRSQPAASSNRTSSRLDVRARAVIHDDEDLLQHPDRIKWYESKFCADDMPNWNVGRFLRSEDIAPGVRNVVLECEMGRERVPLSNAYKAVGQRASVRINSGVEFQLTVSSAPFSNDLNKSALFRVRGDLFAYEIKVIKEPLSTMAELHLMVTREEAPEVYELEADDVVEIGPFQGNGIDLKGSGILGVYMYPTLVMFVSGKGIAHARALLTSASDVANLTPKLRKDVRVYYKVPNSASASYVEDLEALQQQLKPCNFQLVQTTGSFAEAFDDDSTLIYEPETTAALILTGGDAEEEAAALEACVEAEIATVLRDSTEQTAPMYLDSVPPSFMRWKKDPEEYEDVEEEPASKVVPSKQGGKGAKR